ncbi:MAG: helix-turn-helix transcriptional regulator [Lachnospiraceae bacterium]|nr:helix-turn-helix transcriptional regulator [Lachnospiraceae bacterium]
MIDYSPFWNTLRDKRISQYHLIQNGVSTRTLDALRKNKNITILTLETLCRLLDCTPNEIIAFKE